MRIYSLSSIDECTGQPSTELFIDERAAVAALASYVVNTEWRDGESYEDSEERQDRAEADYIARYLNGDRSLVEEAEGYALEAHEVPVLYLFDEVDSANQ